MIRTDALLELKRRQDLPYKFEPFLFEYEVGYKKGRKCVVEAFHLFLLRIETEPGERFFAEAIFGDRPCKLYMDCEAECPKGQKPTPEMILKYIQLVNNTVQIALKPYGVEGNITHLDFSASRSGKFSLHILWNVRFPLARMVRLFVEPISKLDLMGITIDMNPYPISDVPHFLRMPFNFKHDEPDSELRSLDGTGFNLETFCKGLITFFEKDHPLCSKPGPEVVVELKHPKYKHLRPLQTLEESLALEEKAWMDMELTIEYLQVLFPRIIPSRRNVKPDGTFFFDTPMYCVQAGRWHAKILTRIESTKNGLIQRMCWDVDCRQIIPLSFTVHSLGRAKVPLAIDFSVIKI